MLGQMKFIAYYTVEKITSKTVVFLCDLWLQGKYESKHLQAA